MRDCVRVCARARVSDHSAAAVGRAATNSTRGVNGWVYEAAAGAKRMERNSYVRAKVSTRSSLADKWTWYRPKFRVLRSRFFLIRNAVASIRSIDVTLECPRPFRYRTSAGWILNHVHSGSAQLFGGA